jgi:nitroreductase
VIADFPDLAAGTDAEATYRIEAIARLVAAAHEGGRVAVHSTVPGAGELVAAGVGSVEHGFGLDERAIRDMAGRGTAWTPTLGALLALLDAPGMTPGRRRRLREGLARVTELLPLAVRLGVPVLAGTDVTGSIPGEVALLARVGLEPQDALAAASTWPRRFLGAAAAADTVTYHHDPREDPGQLAHPAAVVARGSGCDFILVIDREQLRELAKVWRGAGHVAHSAATIVVVGPAADNEFHRAQLDLGQATMAMMLAAADLGIGSCHAGVADIQLARELLGFPEDRDWTLLISLGYPADRPLAPIKTPIRRPFDDVVHRGRW